MAAAFTLQVAWAQTTDTGVPYTWPLDLPRVITSSFGEPRTGRFHAGIDLRTGGVGPSVRAIADGEVTRVRCSPVGYGKAVYLTLDDGYSVVYAHLDDYAPEIRAYVREAQHAAQSYTVDLTPEPGRFRVAQGDVVAFAGQSGSGPAHLHFEPRNSAGDPISPHLLGLKWDDRTKPVINKLVVAPATAGSTVDGDLLPRAYALARGEGGEYTAPAVRASGDVFVGIDVVDPANDGANRLGIRILRVVVDNEEVFRVQKDRLTYDTMGHGAVAWHPYLHSQGRFLLAWRWPGNRAPVYETVSRDGSVSVRNGPIHMRVETADFHDNRAGLSFAIEPDHEAPDPPAGPDTDTGAGALEVDCAGLWLTVTASFAAPESQTPEFQVDGLTAAGTPFRRIDDRTFRTAYAPGKRSAVLRLAAVHPRIAPTPVAIGAFTQGAGGEASFGEVTVRVPADAPFGRAFLVVDSGRAPQSTALEPLTASWRVSPEDVPFAVPVELSFPAPEPAGPPGKVHVYRRSGSGWSRLDTRREGDRLVARTAALGEFAAFADTTAPSVGEFVPPDGPVANARPRIRASVSDAGSGIAEITATANGRWLLMAYDPEATTVAWEADEDLPSGDVALRLTVADHAGNVCEVTRTIRVP